MNGQVIYTKQDVSPMLFQKEVLDTETSITVAGFKGRICLPRLGGLRSDSGFRLVVAPPNYELGILPKLPEHFQPEEWGYQVRHPSGESTVGAFLLEFDLATTEETARDQMTRIERHLEQWFGCLRDWIEVITEQDLSIDEPSIGASDHGNYLWSWSDGTRWKSAQASIVGFLVRMRDFEQAITVPIWQRGIQRANNGEQPPAPHLLLRDARARLLRGGHKYSVIYSAIGAEIVIKDQIQAALRAQGTPEAFIDRLLGDPLGRLEGYCKPLGIPLPDAFGATVRKTRNLAMHQNAEISQNQAREVLDVSTELIVRYVPIK